MSYKYSCDFLELSKERLTNRSHMIWLSWPCSANRIRYPYNIRIR